MTEKERQAEIERMKAQLLVLYPPAKVAKSFADTIEVIKANGGDVSMYPRPDDIRRRAESYL